jgi:hypothetical protein
MKFDAGSADMIALPKRRRVKKILIGIRSSTVRRIAAAVNFDRRFARMRRAAVGSDRRRLAFSRRLVARPARHLR